MKLIVATMREVAFLIGLVMLIVAFVGPLYTILVLRLTTALETAVRGTTQQETHMAFSLLVLLFVLPIYAVWRIRRARRRRAAPE